MAITVGRSPCTEAEAIRRGFGGRDSARRRQVLAETLRVFLTAKPPEHFHQLARENHERWASAADPSPDTVDVQVLAGEWGEVTLDLSRRFGRIFAVLNMANAYVPGGAYIEGASAQEQNLCRRSDCHFYIRDEDYDRDTDRYRPQMTELISGATGRVYLDTGHPRICIRGAKDSDQPNLCYRWLEEEELFSFYELRSAAQDLRDGGLFNAAIALRQIAAQFDTLGTRHAVLGAFGCDAFRNPAHDVAEIYPRDRAAPGRVHHQYRLCHPVNALSGIQRHSVPAGVCCVVGTRPAARGGLPSPVRAARLIEGLLHSIKKSSPVCLSRSAQPATAEPHSQLA